MIGTAPTDIYREIQRQEANRFPISRSGNSGILEPNRLKHAIYRFGSVRFGSRIGPGPTE